MKDTHTVQGSSTEQATKQDTEQTEAQKQTQYENEFFQTLQNDINKLILSCWEGYRLKDEDKKIVINIGLILYSSDT